MTTTNIIPVYPRSFLNSISINPKTIWKAILLKHNKQVATNEFLFRFLNRNRKEVIVPFLDGLSADYIIIYDDIVLVKQTDEISSQLESLKFINLETLGIEEILRNIRKTTTVSKNRKYNEGYNIDIHLVSAKNYTLANQAKVISDAVLANTKRTTVSMAVSVFMIIYDNLPRLP